MPSEKARILFGYAALLLVLGIVSVLYSPEAGFGFNPKAISGLIVGVVGAVGAAAFGRMIQSGVSWAVQGGMILTFVLLVMCSHRALLSWQKVSAGASEKWFAAAIISVMGAASLVTLVLVARGFGGVRVAPTPRP
ncbi:MAG: hypothetical protein ACR2OZ_06795 [Verrucomicrobiales bacterium]